MDFVKELKKRGYRITNPREVICNILETSGHEHFTVDELHNLATKQDKNIDLATVYRTLDILVKYDFIRKMDIDDGRVRYESNIGRLSLIHI